MSGSLFTLAIVVQMLLIWLSPELVSLAEKIDRRFNKGDKLNLGLATLVLILAAYAYFWARSWPMMNSLGVNLTLMLFQASSLYVAFYSHKLHEDSAL